MREVINLSKQYQPKQALIIYEKGNSQEWGSTPYYLEHHKINVDQQGKARLSEGKPLTKSCLKQLGRAIVDNEKSKTYLKSKGIFSENLLYFHQEEKSYTLTWYQPPSRQKMMFTKKLQIPSGEANVPALIFAVKENRLKVYATKKFKRPNHQTKLYKAPFHNTDDAANVCLGGAEKPSIELKYIEDIMKAWENIFWFTKFSEQHGRPVKGEINELWRKLINTDKPFPKSYLLPSKLKLNQL